ncbi:MAG: class I SAM-dependent methyltransferase [Bacteroidota bacterium]
MNGDLFSKQSDFYSKFRPDYPLELYELVYREVKRYNCAWDCATGNGQVAKVLANQFNTVKASDISEAQLVKAYPKNNIQYSICPSESTSFPRRSFDLIAVGQALHWFNFKPFFEEVKRVSREKAVFAAWTYNLSTIEPDIDAIVSDLYTNILDKYWAPERKHIECFYKSIPIPFDDLRSYKLIQIKEWDIEHYLGYLRSWSAVQKYIDEKAKNPVEIIEFDLRMKWGSGLREVKFPLSLKTAKINR